MTVTDVAVTAPIPDQRLRSSKGIIAAACAVGIAIVAGVTMGLARPLLADIQEANERAERYRTETAALRVEVVELEEMRDNIIAQYDAIQLFTERYPSSPEQDVLYRDLLNSAMLATVRVTGIATSYPELLADGDFGSGSVIRPDQIVINGTDAVDGDGEEIDFDEGTDVNEGDDDIFPLGSIPLTLSASLDGSQAFVDANGKVYVASPNLGYFTYGGQTGRERLSMSVIAESSMSALQEYFADNGGAGTAGWPTVFSPDTSVPPYLDVDLSVLNPADMVTLYQRHVTSSKVDAGVWEVNNAFVPLSSLARLAWFIDEVQTTPGRAILIKFVSASGNSIALSGQQFILRELPPLPESIFGDVNGDGIISDVPVSAPQPSASPSPSAPVVIMTPSPSPSVTPTPSPSPEPPVIEPSVESSPSAPTEWPGQ